MNAKIEAIEKALDDGNYRPGPWQRLIEDLDASSPSEKALVAEDISRVSRKLHGRHGFFQIPFWPALGVELLVFLGAVSLLGSSHVLLDVIGVGLLALTLQPLLKIASGLTLGVRYEYAYLWYFEPRFKMRYGSYLCLGGGSRVVFHLMGSIGTPLALLIGYRVLGAHLDWLGGLSLAAAILAAGMQVGAFAAEWFGVRKVGPFRLSQLTSPATAAYEWKRLLSAG